MDVHRRDLMRAAEDGVLEPETAEALWTYLGQQESGPRFRAAHILYYLGGFVAMAALGLFIGQAWDAWSGWPMLVLAGGFALLGLGLTRRFLDQGLMIPAGVTLTFAISMTPIVVFSIQQILGVWSGPFTVTDYHRWIDWRWIFMELATLAVAAVALWRYRLPFLVFLVACTLWYLQMDLVPFLFDTWEERWEMRKLVSVLSGAAMLVLAFGIELRGGRRPDWAFWLYLAGVAAFSGGLTAMDSDSELGALAYLLVHLGLIGIGAALRRRTLAVFGAFGVAAYLGHLARLFEDTLAFPAILAFTGLGIIFGGVLWQRHEAGITATLRGWLPARLRRLLEEIE
ncbi:DUF2157 domain-containing protein [Guyparkeria halophila]|uniref:DUF2157 domain-containing protein n=1 Tax=Guyparkeria halophila TaxID=47960 RepID=A0ABZ0YY70_9GAMM|nr:DUF2157 domain-containing protein [Guyparkeria halophila]WQH16509.1 DUF2157 domain-containing protein [Guyparkeria halophila]